jgi:hypothetical protein
VGVEAHHTPLLLPIRALNQLAVGDPLQKDLDGFNSHNAFQFTMKNTTKYVFVQIITHVGTTISVDEGKVVRFASELQVRLLRLNRENEVVMSFNEDPRDFVFSDGRTDLFVSLPRK